MSSARDITLTLDDETLRDVTALAAEDGLSVSALLRRVLESMVENRHAYAKAKESALRRLAKGTSFGMGEPVSREDLHDREKLR
jgi:Ribbon-helix-helix protein, copG family